jgi:hypothetical protein
MMHEDAKFFTHRDKSVYSMTILAVRFRYQNWRGEDHEYIVYPESFEFGPYDESGKHGNINPEDKTWVFHGNVLSRDGEQRVETPRRTFLLSKMREVERV